MDISKKENPIRKDGVFFLAEKEGFELSESPAWAGIAPQKTQFKGQNPHYLHWSFPSPMR